MTNGKQYLNKREYLGHKIMSYALKYGYKCVHIDMEWTAGEYIIVWARKMDMEEHLENYADFPYKKTVGVIDKIEELLKE